MDCLSQKTVVNETDRILTSPEIELLALGLNFIPTMRDSAVLINRDTPQQSMEQRMMKQKIERWFDQKGEHFFPRRGLLPPSYLLERSDLSDSFKHIQENQSHWNCLAASPYVTNSAGTRQTRPLKEQRQRRRRRRRTVPSLSTEQPEQPSREKTTAVTASANTENSVITRVHSSLLEAASQLLWQNDFFVVRADKGGCVVLWRVEDYKSEAFRQLNDSLQYRCLNVTHMETTKSSAVASATSQSKGLQEDFWTPGWSPFLEEHLLCRLRIERDILIDRLYRSGYLLPDETIAMKKIDGRIPYIYFQPKVHQRPRHIHDRLRGRPVVAACVGPLFLIDKYLAKLTAPILKLTSGSLANTSQLIERLLAIFRSGDCQCDIDHPCSSAWMGFATADVVSLYPSIPMEEGIRATVHMYERHFGWLCRQASSEHRYRPVDPPLFESALRLVVENSYLTFQNRFYYHQEKGTAMGSCISVFVANSFMFLLTEIVIERPPVWLFCFQRYVDDLFLFGCFHPLHGHNHWEMLFDSISTSHIRYEIDFGESIKKSPTSMDDSFMEDDVRISGGSESSSISSYTGRAITFPDNQDNIVNVSRTCHFLDVEVAFDRYHNTVHFRPYLKPHMAKVYLHRSSQHPNNYFKNIPFSQLVRMKKLSSSRAVFLEAFRQLKKNLKSRGYSHGEIHRSLKRVENDKSIRYASSSSSLASDNVLDMQIAMSTSAAMKLSNVQSRWKRNTSTCSSNSNSSSSSESSNTSNCSSCKSWRKGKFFSNGSCGTKIRRFGRSCTPASIHIERNLLSLSPILRRTHYPQRYHPFLSNYTPNS